MSQQQPSADKSAEVIRRCFAAYGSDVSAWPAEKRDAFGELALSDAFAKERAEAKSLDVLLQASTTRPPRHDLQNRIIAAIDLPDVPLASPKSNLLAMLLRPFPAGALAGVGALGIVSGFFTATTQIASTPETEAYAYLEFGNVVISEEEVTQWAVE